MTEAEDADGSRRAMQLLAHLSPGADRFETFPVHEYWGLSQSAASNETVRDLPARSLRCGSEQPLLRQAECGFLGDVALVERECRQRIGDLRISTIAPRLRRTLP
jgi:hypothetical protein